MELMPTPLHSWHTAHGGRMTDFAGWSMPLQYTAGPLEEHRLVRRSVGLFDISHMGRAEVSGPKATAFLERLITSSLGDLPVLGARYGLLCRPDGGVLDDLFVYRLEGRWLLVLNAANKDKDLAWLRSHAAGYPGLSIKDLSQDLAMIAVQGPEAVRLLSEAAGLSDKPTSGGRPGLPQRLTAAEIILGKAACLAGRTGYTGEDGFEIFVPAAETLGVWEGLLSLGGRLSIEVGPAGLAARDSLRFEPGFALYGHELTEQVNAAEAGLLWACDLAKDFLGRDALIAAKASGLARRLATFTMLDKAVPRQGCKVFDAAGSLVGEVVSGMYCPTIDAFAGNVFVPPQAAKAGTPLAIEIRGAKRSAVTVKRPLYTPSYRKGGKE